MKPIKEIIGNLRVAMTDARQNESHFESWMILNEAICDAIEALVEQPAPVAEPAKQQEPDYHICPTCGGMASDPIVPPSARQQDPVAWMDANDDVFFTEADAYKTGIIPIRGLYTSPPYEATPLASQRSVKPWVGLTDEEILYRVDTHVGGPSPSYPLDNSDWINFSRAIEAKLREKNEHREKNA